MRITTLLFDLDDTLIPQDAVDRAALFATAVLARVRHGVDAHTLASAAREHGERLWRQAPTAPLCHVLGISWSEGLWAEFGDDGDDFSELNDWAPTYRHATWSAALAAVGVGDPPLADDLAETFRRERRERSTVYPEAERVLAALSARYQLGLVTNGAPGLQRAKLTRSGLASYFNTVVISGDIGIGKPDVRIFTMALAQLGASAATAMMVGDNPARDVAGAHNARLRAVWVNRGGRALHPREPDPHHQVTHLAELLPLVLPTTFAQPATRGGC